MKGDGKEGTPPSSNNKLAWLPGTYRTLLREGRDLTLHFFASVTNLSLYLALTMDLFLFYFSRHVGFHN